jgi:hypothetical protein
MTAATEIATIPAGATIVGMDLIGTASNAGTSATLSIGIFGGSGTAYVNARDVKTAGTGTGCMPLTLAVDTSVALTADQKLSATVTEAGTASSSGAWILLVHYVPMMRAA